MKVTVYLLLPSSRKVLQIDLVLPFVTMMEFIIFVGWMKVAEGLLNPFGEDDDDFECNFLLDKNLAVRLFFFYFLCRIR